MRARLVRLATGVRVAPGAWAHRVGAVAVTLGALAALAPRTAHAGSMDPAIERLSVVNEDGELEPDEVAFTRLINAYGFALAPEAFHAARTTGFGGFHIGIEGLYTKMDDDADYLRRGTRGSTDPSTQAGARENSAPSALLQQYSLRMLKGFGFGLEVAGQFGFVPQTSIMNGGADVRFSLLEGFRDGVFGVLPDLAVGGGVRTITGTNQFQLTVAGADAQISKPFTVSDTGVLTPWVGFQYLWIFGDSGLVDLTPTVDAQGACNFQGPNTPGNPVESGDDPQNPTRDGQPVCDGGSNDDFNNNVVFDPVRLQRQRFLVGMSYHYEMVSFAGQFMMDWLPPDAAQTDSDNEEALEGVPKQWSFVLELGAQF
jgi:hypothetical protein